MSRWSDRVVLVVGGSTGVGLALAKEWAGQGARIILASRNRDRLATAAESIHPFHNQVDTIPTDVLSSVEVDQLMALVQERYGALHVLANCAGKSMRGRIADTSVDQHRELWELNFGSVVRTTIAALPLLRQSAGSVVQIGSLASRIAAPYLGAYPCSKFPLVAFAQQLRMELAPAVHVLLVLPGPIARDDAGSRYHDETMDLPRQAMHPGGGARLSAIPSAELARRIRIACERRMEELVMPARAKWLFALNAIAPGWGDWIIRRLTRGD